MDVLETCLYARNLQEVRDFYTRVVGLECFVWSPPRQAFFRTGQSVFLVFNPEETRDDDKLPPHGAEGSVHICFRVASDDDVRAWKDRLEARGYETFDAEWPYGISVYVYDPAGNLVEFAPAKIWGIEST